MNKEVLRAISVFGLFAGALEMAIGFGGSEVNVIVGSLGILTLLSGTVGIVQK